MGPHGRPRPSQGILRSIRSTSDSDRALKLREFERGRGFFSLKQDRKWQAKAKANIHRAEGYCTNHIPLLPSLELSVSPAAGTLPLLALTLNRWSSTKDIRTGWLAQRVRVAPASAVQSFSPKPTLMGIICANAAGEAGLFGDWSVNLQPGTRNDVPDVLSCVCVGLNLFGIEYIYIDSTKRTFSQINE